MLISILILSYALCSNAVNIKQDKVNAVCDAEKQFLDLAVNLTTNGAMAVAAVRIVNNAERLTARLPIKYVTTKAQYTTNWSIYCPKTYQTKYLSFSDALTGRARFSSHIAIVFKDFINSLTLIQALLVSFWTRSCLN